MSRHCRLLVLPDVCESDVHDDMLATYKARLTGQVRSRHARASAKPAMAFSKPPKYYDAKTWPDNMELMCYNCSDISKGRLYPVIGDGNEVLHICCSAPCASAVIDTKKQRKQWVMHQRLLDVYFDFHGVSIVHLSPARDRSDIIDFGGSLTRKEYREYNKQLLQIDVQTTV